MKVIPKIYFGLLLLLIASLTFSYKVNSICIIALFVIWLIDGGFALKFKRLIREPFFVLNILLFGLYVLGIAWSDNKATARFFVEKNLALVVLPLVMLSMKRVTEQEFFVIARVFVGCTCAVMAWATVLAVNHWLRTQDNQVFFYHELAGHVGLSAIIASLLCIVSMALLFALPGWGRLKWIGVFFLSLWLLLLSSKLFLFMLGVMLFLNVLTHIGRKTKIAVSACLLLVLLMFGITDNPIRKRFEDMGKFHTGYLTAARYDPGMYFDGLSMRLIFVKFGLEIFRERGNYVFGVGTGDAEHLLQEKIKAYNMYLGDGVKDKQGYLQYGYHNQLLQKMLQLGLLGLALFTGMIIYVFAIANRHRNTFLRNLMLIFTLTFFTDTLLEHQVGLIMFLSFTCLAINHIRAKQETDLSAADIHFKTK